MATSNARVNIYINDNEVKNSVRGMNMEMRKLTNELGRMKIGSQAYIAQMARIRELRGTLEQHRRDLSGTAGAWSQMKTTVLGVLGGNMLTGLISGVANAVRNYVGEIVEGSAKLSDELADIQKTTGLTAEAVKQLNSELGKLDTRTSTSELRKLAFIAGKLGKESKNDVLEFVEAADQLTVALGEDLGGTDAIRQLGKLSQIFNIEQTYGTREGLLKIGSVINELGASSVANEGYLVKFAQRFGGLGENAGMALDQVMGLGATLDILGKNNEIAASSMAQLVINLGSEKGIARFAGLAKMSLDEFSDTLRNNANEALLKVLEGANSTENGVMALTEVLESLGVSSIRQAQVLPGLAANIKLLREQQDLAKKSFEEGTSVTAEFNIKNNNLAASLEKIGKAMRKVFVNPAMMDGIHRMVSGVADYIAIPLSQKLEEEQTQANLLVMKILDHNTATEDKLKLLKVLNDLSPMLAKAMEDERTRVENSTAALQDYNNAMREKIILQKEGEEIAELMAKSVRFDARANSAEALLQETMVRQVNVENFFGEYTEQAREILMRPNRSLDSKASALAGLAIQAQPNPFAKGSGDIFHQLKAYQTWKEEKGKVDREIVQKQLELQLLKEAWDAAFGDAMISGKAGSTTLTDDDVVVDDTKKGGRIPIDEKQMAEAARKYEAFLKLLDEIRMKSAEMGMDEQEREERAVYMKYEAHFADISALTEDMEKQRVAEKRKYTKEELEMIARLHAIQAELEEQKLQELIAINEKYEEERLQAKKDAEIKISDAVLSEKEQEIARAKKHYAELIKLAELYSIDTAELYEALKRTLAEIDKKYAKKDGPGDEKSFLHDEEFQLKLEGAKQLASQLTEIWSNYYKILEQKEELQMQQHTAHANERRETLARQLERGIISQQYYAQEVKRIDEQLDAKKAELARQQAIRTQRVATFESVVKLAAGIVDIWTKYGANPIMAGVLTAGMVGVAATQIAAIHSEPLPKFAAGGRVPYPTVAMVGEAGEELILSNRMLTHPTYGPMAENLARIQEGRAPLQPNFAGAGQAGKELAGLYGRMREVVEALHGMKYIQAVISDTELKERQRDDELRIRYTKL
jgi:TP901 family phage tail tape measure protein